MARIILADDDELIAELVRETLQAAGHIVGVVNDGATALKAILLKQPDLVILDCFMPGLPGVEVVRHLRNRWGAHQTPVLMLTARTSKIDEELALRAGADDYMTKPFDRAKLVRKVEELLMQAAERKARAGRS